MHKRKYLIILFIFFGSLGISVLFLQTHMQSDQDTTHSHLMPYDPSIKAPPLPNIAEIMAVALRKQKSEWIKPTKAILPAPPLVVEGGPFAKTKISKTVLIKQTHPIPPAPTLPPLPKIQ